MRTLLRTLLRWLDRLRLPLPEPYEPGDSGGLADRELDGLPPGKFAASTSPATKPRDRNGIKIPARASDKPGTVKSGRPLPQDANSWWENYQAWKKTVNLLAAGRAPESLTVPHSLSLAKVRLRSLPSDLTVQGDLDLRQCQRLKTIGEGLNVWGDLLIGGRRGEVLWWETFLANDPQPGVLQILSQDGQCPLSELPAALRVEHDLRLCNCRRLERLPDDLRVGRSIRLEGCTALASLPDRLEVHGDLTISSAPSLTALPAGLRVEGSLRLIGVRVERLPDDLSVGGDLILECCHRLTSLAENLEVGGSLIVRRCPTVRLPSTLRVGRDLKLHRLRDLAGLPEGLSIPGRLELVRCPSVQEIPFGLRVGSNLVVRCCDGLRELPEGLHVPGTLDLRDCTRLEACPGA